MYNPHKYSVHGPVDKEDASEETDNEDASDDDVLESDEEIIVIPRTGTTATRNNLGRTAALAATSESHTLSRAKPQKQQCIKAREKRSAASSRRHDSQFFMEPIDPPAQKARSAVTTTAADVKDSPDNAATAPTIVPKLNSRMPFQGGRSGATHRFVQHSRSNYLTGRATAGQEIIAAAPDTGHRDLATAEGGGIQINDDTTAMDDNDDNDNERRKNNPYHEFDRPDDLVPFATDTDARGNAVTHYYSDPRRIAPVKASRAGAGLPLSEEDLQKPNLNLIRLQGYDIHAPPRRPHDEIPNPPPNYYREKTPAELANEIYDQQRYRHNMLHYDRMQNHDGMLMQGGGFNNDVAFPYNTEKRLTYHDEREAWLLRQAERLRQTTESERGQVSKTAQEIMQYDGPAPELNVRPRNLNVQHDMDVGVTTERPTHWSELPQQPNTQQMYWQSVDAPVHAFAHAHSERPVNQTQRGTAHAQDGHILALAGGHDTATPIPIIALQGERDPTQRLAHGSPANVATMSSLSTSHQHCDYDVSMSAVQSDRPTTQHRGVVPSTVVNSVASATEQPHGWHVSQANPDHHTFRGAAHDVSVQARPADMNMSASGGSGMLLATQQERPLPEHHGMEIQHTDALMQARGPVGDDGYFGHVANATMVLSDIHAPRTGMEESVAGASDLMRPPHDWQQQQPYHNNAPIMTSMQTDRPPRPARVYDTVPAFVQQDVLQETPVAQTQVFVDPTRHVPFRGVSVDANVQDTAVSSSASSMYGAAASVAVMMASSQRAMPERYTNPDINTTVNDTPYDFDVTSSTMPVSHAGDRLSMGTYRNTTMTDVAAAVPDHSHHTSQYIPALLEQNVERGTASRREQSAVNPSNSVLPDVSFGSTPWTYSRSTAANEHPQRRGTQPDSTVSLLATSSARDVDCSSSMIMGSTAAAHTRIPGHRDTIVHVDPRRTALSTAYIDAPGYVPTQPHVSDHVTTQRDTAATNPHNVGMHNYNGAAPVMMIQTPSQHIPTQRDVQHQPTHAIVAHPAWNSTGVISHTNHHSSEDAASTRGVAPVEGHYFYGSDPSLQTRTWQSQSLQSDGAADRGPTQGTTATPSTDLFKYHNFFAQSHVPHEQQFQRSPPRRADVTDQYPRQLYAMGPAPQAIPAFLEVPNGQVIGAERPLVSENNFRGLHERRMETHQCDDSVARSRIAAQYSSRERRNHTDGRSITSPYNDIRRVPDNDVIASLSSPSNSTVLQSIPSRDRSSGLSASERVRDVRQGTREVMHVYD